MDDIYADLDNYTHEDIIDELRKENTDLKIKVEEYEVKVTKLQRDYDIISSEFQKMAVNYSSLLKTAKAEVERKAQMISNLNMEKDTLVLSSIQNSNKSLLMLRRNMAQERSNSYSNYRKAQNDEPGSVKTCKKDVQEVKKAEPEKKRNYENRLPSVDTMSSEGAAEITKSSIIDDKLCKLDSYENISDSKENITKGKKALTLKHRRKSMPVINKASSKFSSDEEYEGDCSEELKKERLSREEKPKKYFDRHKISETSGIDEKYSSYHESSRETYYKGKSYRGFGKLKSLRDRSRHKKHYSPEKVRRKEYHSGERQELFRHDRVLVSPVRDSYDPLRMLRDRRSNHESERPYEGRLSRRDDFHDERLKRKDSNEDRYSQRDDYFAEKHLQREDCREEEKRTRKYDSHDETRRNDSRSDDRSKGSRFEEKHRHDEKNTRKYDSLESKQSRVLRSDERLRGSSLDKKHTQEEKKPRKKHSREEIQQSNSRSDERTRESNFDEKHDENNSRKYDSHDVKQRSDTRSDERPSGSPLDKKLQQEEQHMLNSDPQEEIKRSDSHKLISDGGHTGSAPEERHKLINNIEKLKSKDNPLDPRLKHKNESSKERNTVEEQKNHCEEKNGRRRIRPIRLKSVSDNDEPSSKRPRLDPFKKTVEEKDNSCPEKPPPADERLIPQFAEHLQHTSCQSPDNPHQDIQPNSTVTQVQPKEIMTTTSACNLEDPRLSSKKYVKGTEGDKVVLATVTGRNVDLIAIDRSTWNIPSVEKPEALRQPPEYTNEMVQKLYMDIDNPAMDMDNPVSNMSLELGELNSESSDVRMADYLSRNFYQDYENERLNQMEARDEKFKNRRGSRMEPNINPKESVNRVMERNDRKLPPVKYKIPRASKPELLTESTPDPIGILLKQIQSVCNVDTAPKPPEAKLDVDATFGKDDESNDNNAEKKEEKPNETRQLQGRKVSTQELVERDLELSDETCDNVFIRKQRNKGKLKEQTIQESKTEDQKGCLDIENKPAKPADKTAEKSNKPKTDNKVKSQLNTKIEEKTNVTPKELTDDKSVKKIRKKSISGGKKPLSAKDSSKTVDVEIASEKKIKAKKTQSPKDTKDENKGKFTELFGDSCSLITPEDLGVLPTVQTDRTEKYVPIFEDAQDAVDVNVTAMKIKMVQQSKTYSEIETPAVVGKSTKSVICKINLPIPTTKENDTIQRSVKDTSDTKDSDEKVTIESEVVKTVVISTGVQPTIQNIDAKKADKSENVVVTAEVKVQEVHIPVALATSTPHKNLLLQLEENRECSGSYNSSDVQASSVNHSSMSNEMCSETQIDDDKPDVRIFMKRRRRLKK